MTMSSPWRVFLPVALLAAGGLMICSGCEDKQQTASTSPDGMAAQGPPPGQSGPPVVPAAHGQGNSSSAGQQSGPAGPGLPSPEAGMSGNPTAPAAPSPSPETGSSADGRPRANARPQQKPKPLAPPVEGFLVGNLAPEIFGEDLDDEPFRLSDYRGKVVVVDFWGDW